MVLGVHRSRRIEIATRRALKRNQVEQVWTDPTVWLSYDPGSAAGRFGATLGKEVTLSHYACRIGSWTLVATLIHELAHVNGANGVTHDAEATLQKCLMGQHHDPTIMGQIRSASKLTRIG